MFEVKLKTLTFFLFLSFSVTMVSLRFFTEQMIVVNSFLVLLIQNEYFFLNLQ